MNDQTTDYYSKWKSLLQPQALPPKPEQEEEEDYYAKWKTQLAQTQAPPSQDLWQRKSILEKVMPYLKPEGLAKQIVPEMPLERKIKEAKEQIVSGKELAYWKDVASVDWWKKRFTKLYQEAKTFAGEMARRTMVDPRMAMQEMEERRSVMRGVEPEIGDRDLMMQLAEKGQELTGLVTWLPSTFLKIIQDPMKMAEEHPFDTVAALTIMAGKPMHKGSTKIKADWNRLQETMFAKEAINTRQFYKIIDNISNDVIPPNIKKRLKTEIPPDYNIAITREKVSASQMPFIGKQPAKAPPGKPTFAIKDKGKVYVDKKGVTNHGDLALDLMEKGIELSDRAVGGFVDKQGNWKTQAEGRAMPGMEEPAGQVEYFTSERMAREADIMNKKMAREQALTMEEVQKVIKESKIGKPEKPKEPWQMTREEFANPDLKIKKITRSEFETMWKQPVKPGERPLGQHFDPKTNIVVIEEGASKSVIAHEKAHSYAEEVKQNPLWEWAIDETPEAGKALAGWNESAKKWGGGKLPKEIAWNNDPKNPRNYNWRETGASVIADYLDNKLPLALSNAVEKLGRRMPGTKLSKLIEHKDVVRQALSEGKPVSPEILAEYPDLKLPKTEKPLTEAEQIAAYEKAGKVEKVPYAPERAKAMAEYEAMAEEAKAVGLETGKPKMPPTKEVKPLTREEIISAKLPEGVKERIQKEVKKAEDVFDELYSGYPFIKEFKESLRRLRKGEAGVLITKIEKTPLPTRTQTITPKTEKIELQSYSVPTKEPLIVVKQNKAGSMPVFKHELDPLLKIQDLPPRKVKYYYENPIRIFEDYPSLKRDVYNPIKVAENSWVKDFQTTKSNIKQYKQTTPSGSSKRLGIYSVSKQKGGMDTLKSMRITDMPKLSPAELKVYNEVRANLEKVYIEINQARKLAGYQPMPKVDNYFTFARNLETLKELGINPIFERDLGILTRHLNAPFFKYGLKRRKVAAPVELDFFTVYENYMNTALKFIHKAPVISKGRALIGDYTFGVGKTKASWSFKQEYPKLHTYITQWLDFNSGQKPPTIAPQWLGNMATKLSRNIGTAVLTYNVRSALIQPTALRGSYIELGGRYLAEGIIDNFNPAMRKFATENSNVLRGRKMDIHVEEMLSSAIKKRAGKIRRGVAKVGITPLQFLDLEAARATWLGGYKRATKQLKLSHKDAVIHADDLVTKTQASAQPSDIAPIQRSGLGKLGTIFQTFVINEWNFLSKNVLGFKNPQMKTTQRVVKVARLVWSTALINALFEGIFKVRSPYPAPEWAVVHGLEKDEDWQQIVGSALKEMGEQIPVIGGSIRWSTPYRTAWPAPLQVAEGTLKIVDKTIRELDVDKLRLEDAETVGRLLGIPGTGQAMKYIRRRKKGMSHAEAILGIRTDIPGDKKYAY